MDMKKHDTYNILAFMGFQTIISNKKNPYFVKYQKTLKLKKFRIDGIQTHDKIIPSFRNVKKSL